MILDITYLERAPEQIQRVRMATIYNYESIESSPEIVIQYENHKPQTNIWLHTIKTITVTND